MRSFSFNGIIKPYIYVEEKSNRPPWAPVTRGYQQVPGRPGAHLIKKTKVEPRPLPIPVYFKAESIADLQKMKEELAAWLIHDDPKPLVFDDEPDRTYYAIVDGSFDVEEFVRTGKGTIPFICPDPYKYGEEKTVPINSGGRIVNNGTVDTNPVLTITFTAATNNFEITCGSKMVRVIYNFIKNDVLTIDMDKRKVLINNVVNMTAYAWDSQPFSLTPGNNTLTFTAGVDAKVTYRERWK